MNAYKCNKCENTAYIGTGLMRTVYIASESNDFERRTEEEITCKNCGNSWHVSYTDGVENHEDACRYQVKYDIESWQDKKPEITFKSLEMEEPNE